MHPTTIELSQTELFQRKDPFASWDDRVRLSHIRAIAIGKAYNLTAEDLLHVTPRYMEFHSDPIILMDDSAVTLLTTHLNLYAGALAMFAPGRPDIQAALDKALRFEELGGCYMTELHHGLDVINLETTATLKPDGTFDFHTPHKGAVKFMPPSVPNGTPSRAVVFARLMVDGENRGVKPFLVPIHDGYSMCPGVTSKRLTPLASPNPVNHAMTRFDHVQLPSTALLTTLDRAEDRRAEFFHDIWRVIVGSLSLAGALIPGLRVISFIAGKYSLRRTVTDASTGLPRPIISFSTQYIPVMSAVADTFVLIPFVKSAHAAFTDPKHGPEMKHFLAAVSKVTLFERSLKNVTALGDRCGAQGLLQANQFNPFLSYVHSMGVAEGDIVGISIRFAVDLALGRVAPPPSSNPKGRLACHEADVISQVRSRLRKGGPGSHRSPEVEAAILPLCVPLIQAVGHRMAYDAAIEASVDPNLIDIYVASIVSTDPAWYSEATDPAVRLSRSEQSEMQLNACKKGVVRLGEWLDKLEIEPYVLAPIVSQEKWDAHEQRLDTFTTPHDTWTQSSQVSARL